MSAEQRILFTSVGRRVELMQAFREASLVTGIPLKIYGADMDMSAPALCWCDVQRQSCAIRDEAYVPSLLKMCADDQIDLLIPTIDTDLLVLAQNRQAFEKQGTKVLVADADKVALCRDKRLTGDFFESCGLLAPKAVDDWRDYTGPYPCFIKPKDGSSSINAYKVGSFEELAGYASRVSDYIVQPFIDGREYTIDIFCDYDGKPISIVPRERLAVRAGEVLKTRIDLDDRMIAAAKSIVKNLRPRGAITVQLIRSDETSEDWFIEINPRYGGGAPLSMKAGARSAESVLCMLAGVEQTVQSISHNAVYSRFDQSVCIQQTPKTPVTKGVIFDLDDTLYLERDYVRSGFRAIARYMKDEDADEELWSSFNAGEPAINAYVKNHNCGMRKKELLDVYRNHEPEIELLPGVDSVMNYLLSRGIRIGIVTDGRSKSQRNKICALGLNKYVNPADIIITDELGGAQFRKPTDISFRIMCTKWMVHPSEVVYVGDNTYKDFQAPKQLGMRCVFFNNNAGLYGGEACGKSSITQIASIEELKLLL